MSTLEHIQYTILTNLHEDAILQGLSVLAWPQSNLHQRLQTKNKSNIGTSIVVMPPIPLTLTPYVAWPSYETISIKIRLSEHLYTIQENRQTSILKIAETISLKLHEQSLQGNGWQIKLAHPHRFPWKEITDKTHPNTNIIELEFIAAFSLCK